MKPFESTVIATAGSWNERQWLTRPVIQPDSAGFDSAEGTLLWRGTQQSLFAAFPVGGTAGAAALPDQPSGATMYCMGAKVMSREGAEHLIASVSWRGISVAKNAPGGQIIATAAAQQVLSIALSATGAEVTFPIQRDGAQIYAGVPYCPPPKPGESVGLRTVGVLATGASAVSTIKAPWRVRTLGRVWTARVRGITIGAQSSFLAPPKLLNLDPYKLTGAPAFDWSKLPDPLVTWNEDTGDKDGWFCSNWQPPSNDVPIGSKVLAFWSADYEWIRRYGPG